LLELGDKRTAKKVRKRLINHPLVDNTSDTGESVNWYFTTRMVRDLTNGKYRGDLLTEDTTELFDAKMLGAYFKKGLHHLVIPSCEFNAGYIHTGIPDNIQYSTPAIIMMDYSPLGGHAIADIATDFIDNGGELKRMGGRLMGILTIRENTEETAKTQPYQII
jgi:hypothetical protein